MGPAVPPLGLQRLPVVAVARKPINNNEREDTTGVGDEDASLASITRQYAHYAITGLMFPVSIALGFFGGYMLDRWLGTVPLFALIGLIFGVAAAIRNLLQTVATDDDTRR